MSHGGTFHSLLYIDISILNLCGRFRQMQMKADNTMSEMNNEVKLKSFESQRTQMVYEETVRTLKESQLENEKLSKKLEVCLLKWPAVTL